MGADGGSWGVEPKNALKVWGAFACVKCLQLNYARQGKVLQVVLLNDEANKLLLSLYEHKPQPG
jgi:hypothetical protein